MSDVEEDYDSDSDGYDINDPRTREHEAYKIAQDNAGRSTRRFRYGDDVDADGTNHDAREEDNHDSMELRLQNAREARGWALDEANRRYEWNGRWAGGSHDEVEDEADKRMADVERWNGVIDEGERHLDQARDARAHNPDSDSDSSSDGEANASSSSSGEEDVSNDNEEEYTKNIHDAREARERRYDYDDQDEEQEEERYDDDLDDEDEEEYDSFD